MKPSLLRLGLVVAVAVTALVGVGIVLDGAPTSSPDLRTRSAVVDVSGSAAGSGGQVATLEARVEQLPADWSAWAALALARVEHARTTGDPAQYALADAAITRSFELRADDNLTAMLARAGLAASRHDFGQALAAADAAIAIAPDSAAAHGARADALIELGRYDEAEDAVFAALDRRPGVANLARASYLFELQGRTDRAVDAMQRAADLALASADVAFTNHHLGTLAFDRGAIDEAVRHFEAARSADPRWAAPTVGLARVDAARGEIARARERLERIVDRLPLPEYVAFAAELAIVDGDEETAADLYALLDVQRVLLEANDANADLEVALAEADRGERPGVAVDIASAEWERRRSIHVADALAWALYVDGRAEEALDHARYAVSLGTRSAVLHFHLGMIEVAVGDDAAGRASLRTALEINPSFSPRWAPVAAQTLEALEG